MSKFDEIRTFKRYRWKKMPWYKPDELETYEEQMTVRDAIQNSVWLDPSLVVESIIILSDEIEELKKSLAEG